MNQKIDYNAVIFNLILEVETKNLQINKLEEVN